MCLEKFIFDKDNCLLLCSKLVRVFSKSNSIYFGENKPVNLKLYYNPYLDEVQAYDKMFCCLFSSKVYLFLTIENSLCTKQNKTSTIGQYRRLRQGELFFCRKYRTTQFSKPYFYITLLFSLECKSF